MDLDHELRRIAELYSKQGYQVTIRPGKDELPAFARDFTIEILGKRGLEGVLVTVKMNREELAADANVGRYAEVTGSQTGWRFDLAILEGDNPMGQQDKNAIEFSGDDINKAIAEAGLMLDRDFAHGAVITAWAALEAAMRTRLRADGQKTGWGSDPRVMLNELYSSGLIVPEEFHRLEDLSKLRNQIVHGFSPASPSSLPEAVHFLSDLAQRLLNESQLTIPTA